MSIHPVALKEGGKYHGEVSLNLNDSHLPQPFQSQCCGKTHLPAKLPATAALTLTLTL